MGGAFQIKLGKDILLLNYLLLIIYAGSFIFLKAEITDQLLFSTVDSLTYWSAGHNQGYGDIRPFLYPLLLVTLHKLGGAYALWIVQALFWFLSANLIFLAIKKLTQNHIYSFLGTLVLASNLSYLILTMIALTETTVIFLLSILVYFVSSNYEKSRSISFIHVCIFILALLTVLKPVFYLPLLVVLFAVLPSFYFKKYITQPINLLVLFLVLSPLFYQLYFMQTHYHVFSVSKISGNTLSWGLFSRGLAEKDGISITAARELAEKMPRSEQTSVMLNNKTLYLKMYLNTLKENIDAIPCFTLYPNNFTIPIAYNYMIWVNKVYFGLHILFLLPAIFCIYFNLRQKMWGISAFLIPAFFIIYYILLTSPVSFGEGDRLVLIALPLWISLYFYTINFWKLKLFRK